MAKKFIKKSALKKKDTMNALIEIMKYPSRAKKVMARIRRKYPTLGKENEE